MFLIMKMYPSIFNCFARFSIKIIIAGVEENVNYGEYRLARMQVELNVEYETVQREGRTFALIEV